MADPRDHPMHIDNVRARRAADEAERGMFRDLAKEIDGPPAPGIGALLKQALQQGATDTGSAPGGEGGSR